MYVENMLSDANMKREEARLFSPILRFPQRYFFNKEHVPRAGRWRKEDDGADGYVHEEKSDWQRI